VVVRRSSLVDRQVCRLVGRKRLTAAGLKLLLDAHGRGVRVSRLTCRCADVSTWLTCRCADLSTWLTCRWRNRTTCYRRTDMSPHQPLTGDRSGMRRGYTVRSSTTVIPPRHKNPSSHAWGA
jgi:hypothetical protein